MRLLFQLFSIIFQEIFFVCFNYFWKEINFTENLLVCYNIIDRIFLLGFNCFAIYFWFFFQYLLICFNFFNDFFLKYVPNILQKIFLSFFIIWEKFCCRCLRANAYNAFQIFQKNFVYDTRELFGGTIEHKVSQFCSNFFVDLFFVLNLPTKKIYSSVTVLQTVF